MKQNLNWKIQSIIFNREYYTKRTVKAWIIRNGYKLLKIKNPIRKYGNQLRVRQLNPNLFKKYKVITIKNRRIKAVYGLLK